MRAFKNAGLTVAAMKPVSAGCEQKPFGLHNDDALRLMKEASVDFPYEIVNPYAFEPPIAPHIAASDADIEIDINIIKQSYKIISDQVDIVFVEGAGGWLVPITQNQTMADLAKELNLEVLLIVGIRLGCLNHALLTSESICSHKLNQIGWIANQPTNDMLQAQNNINSLKQRLTSNYLGYVPTLKNASTHSIAKKISLHSLLQSN